MIKSRILIYIVAGLILIACLPILIYYLTSDKPKDAPIVDAKYEEQEGKKKEENEKEKEKAPGILQDATSYPLTMLAIGDFGATNYKEGSCCNRYRKTGKNTEEYYKDYWAQHNIADLLSISAQQMEPKPKVIIGHGDNFYWNGVGKNDVASRFEATFENVYSQESLKGIPWINVAGNHDLGGQHFICGDREFKFRECTSTQEMLEYLNRRFNLQRDYKSPYQNRWKMPGHYYKYSISNGDASVDIYNVDTNFADSNGAYQICCQCYGYTKELSNPPVCATVNRGHKYCCGGNVEMYDACMNEIKSWWEMSLKGLEDDLKISTADFRVINSHYSPHFHMSPPKREQWYKLLRKYNVQVWLNGHTHGENHDYAADLKTHFFENGAGGGIQSETSGHPPPDASNIKGIWIGNNAPYGFFELYASKDILKMQFITFDSNWKFRSDKELVEKGGRKVDHCWFIPKDGSKGNAC